MTKFQEGCVEADGFRVRYLEAGSGPPPMDPALRDQRRALLARLQPPAREEAVGDFPRRREAFIVTERSALLHP